MISARVQIPDIRLADARSAAEAAADSSAAAVSRTTPDPDHARAAEVAHPEPAGLFAVGVGAGALQQFAHARGFRDPGWLDIRTRRLIRRHQRDLGLAGPLE